MIVTIGRKPLVGSVIENITSHNIGGINVDQTRIPTSEITGRPTHKSNGWKNSSEYTGSMSDDWKKGRWPANVVLSESVVESIDKQSSVSADSGVSRFFKKV